MPVKLGDSTKAIRAGKGDLDGTTAIGADGMPYNIEFDRIYFGSDLKFDKYTSKYFVVKNTGNGTLYIKLTKVGSTWNTTTAPTMVYCLPHDSIYRTEHSLTYDNSYSVPAGEMICFRNTNTNSGAGFSQSSENYLNFFITSYSGNNPSIEIDGSFSALAPAIYTANDDSVELPDYCFYKLFYTGIPSGIPAQLVTSPTDIEKFVSCGKDCFAYAFFGSTASSKNGIVSFKTMSFFHLCAGAFYKTFMNSNISSSTNAIYSKICDSIDWNDSYSYGVFESAFENCVNLTHAVRLSNDAEGPYKETMHTSTEAAYKRTFANCTGILSTNEQYIYVYGYGEPGAIVAAHSLYQTFYGCTNLRNPLTLKRDPLITHRYEISVFTQGFYQTFMGCSQLTKPIYAHNGNSPALPKHPWHCPKHIARGARAFEGMYKNCISLESEDIYDSRPDEYYPGANSIKLETDSSVEDFNSAYAEMFYGCTSLYDMHDIFNGSKFSPALCKNMFAGCTSLVYAQVPRYEIAATSYSSCFEGMFDGCSALIRVDNFYLPNTQTNCCKNMFRNCSSLKSSPCLDAETIASGAYDGMFYGCSSLECIITNQSQQGSNTTNWTYGLPTDTWRKYIKLNTNNTYNQKNTSPNTSNANYIPYNWGITSKVLMFRSDESFSIKLKKIGTPYTRTINYMFTNGTSSQVLQFNTNISVTANTGILIWSDAASTPNFSTSTSNYYQFEITGNNTNANVYCYGSLSALTKMTDGLFDFGAPYTFYRLFYNCVKLVSAPTMPLCTAGQSYKYYQAFMGCTGLKFLSGISGSLIAARSFYQTFKNCTSLETPLDLSTINAVNASGCAEMYNGCTALKTVGQLPSSLGSTIGTYAFSYMYLNCKELLNIPSGYLPYTSISECCYAGMFSGCEGITSVPEDLLPATTLANGCYKQMFKNCGFRIAPYLPATTLVPDCYTEMFSGCKYLSKLNVEFTDWGYNNSYRNTKGWVTGVEIEDGQFYCQSSLASLYNNQYNLSNSNTISGISDQTACYIPYNWVRNPHGQIPDDVFRFTRVSGTTNVLFSDTSKYEVSRDGWNWSTPSSSMPVNATYTVLCVRYKYYNNTFHRPYETMSMSGTGTVNVSGNICYLFDKDGTASNCACSYLFAGYSNVKDCSGMYFNGTPTVNAYQMFYNSGVTKVKRSLFDYVKLTSAAQAFMNCSYLQYGANCLCYNDLLDYGIFKQTYKNCTALRSSIVDSGAPGGNTSRLCFGSTKTFTPQISDEAFYQVCEGCSNANFTAIYLQLNKLAYNTSGIVYHTFKKAFKNCTNLATVHSHQENWPGTTNTEYWLENTASSGNFYRRSTLSNIHGYANIPIGWNAPTWTPS